MCKNKFCSVKLIAGNDGLILQNLPVHVRNCYPVEPRYATGPWHLSSLLTHDIEAVIKTYASGDFVSAKLLQSQGKAYERAVETYLSRGARSNFVTFEEFTGEYPPSGANIRESFKSAE